MERINLYYLIGTVFVILFVWLIMVPTIIRILENSNADTLYRWIVLAIIMPIITIILLYITLSYIRKVFAERHEEKIKEIITPELTEKEVFDEAIFENEKLRVLNVIHTFRKLKGNKIPLSMIQEKTGFELDDIEDMVILLMSEELLDGDLTYPDDGPLLILPEKKEVKVTYKPDSIDEKQKDEQEE